MDTQILAGRVRAHAQRKHVVLRQVAGSDVGGSEETGFHA